MAQTQHIGWPCRYQGSTSGSCRALPSWVDARTSPIFAVLELTSDGIQSKYWRGGASSEVVSSQAAAVLCDGTAPRMSARRLQSQRSLDVARYSNGVKIGDGPSSSMLKNGWRSRG